VSGDKKNSESYKEYFPYMQVGRDDMVIFSRYPITANKTILFEETNNSAMWVDIDVKGSEFRVFNIHLETTGINRTLHKAGKLMAQGGQVDNNRLINAIVGNYMMGMMFRSGQAITVANEKRESDKPVILCGDLNVAHEEIDIKNPKTNRHNAGFTDEERAKFSELLAAGFTDSFRFKYPDEVKYSWWSYRFQARQKNAGWRIDYFVISDRLRERLDDARIHTDILGSDHCPVELTLR
jgi:exodeoxyribonuclease III